MEQYNLTQFYEKARQSRSTFRKFLTRLKKNPPRGLDQLAATTDRELWQETDCLSCGNCCKTMSPTYTITDIRRISKKIGINEKDFISKWLRKDRDGDWINKSLPCQFLDPVNNHCSIYEVRPKDCSGFPHHNKRKMVDYMHVFKQNIELCPATFRLVEKMMEKLG